MIDIHTHVLYGMDDGAKDLETSLAMLDMAADTGTTDIVGTPHCDPTFEFKPALIAERVKELNEEMEGRIRIHSGCDFHLTFDNVNDALANPAKYTIGGRNYLLIELSDITIFKSTEPDYERLQAAGMRLIITHPERNPLLQQRMEQLEKWIDMGCYLQVTADSLFGRFGRRAHAFAEGLMDRNMVHILASDGHDTVKRPPVLQDAYKHVSKKWGEKRASLLMTENPGAVLRGEELASLEQPAVKKAWQFWK